MSISLADYEARARDAVATFWATRGRARAKQEKKGVVDVGHRSAVTAGKNMDGFVNLVKAVVVENGLSATEVYSTAEEKRKFRHVTLPGYYRPIKDWDLLVIHNDQLSAALEFKSQVGPSFGNNFNNRCEEALGMATDLWTAFREGAFQESPRPFVGYLMLLEDSDTSRSPVRTSSKHFPIFPEFEGASYADRYQILCEKLVQEGLYETATLLLSPADTGPNGEYTELSKSTGLRRLVTELAGHIAAAAAME